MSEKLNKTKIFRQKPKNLKSEDDKLFNHEYQKHLKNSKVKTLKNVYISESKLKKYKYFRIHAKQWRMNPINLIDKIIFFIKDLKTFLYARDNSEIETIKTAIWAVDSRSYQYFHWLTDALQRIEASKKYYDKGPLILLPGFQNYQYIKDSLDILGIESFILEDNKKYFVEELILSERVSPAGNYRKELINTISNNFKKNIENLEARNDFKKIWVSRQNALKRRILNFEEIEPILEKNNFKIINYENLTFRDQIKISNNAQIIGGVHGAGLTNMIFLNKNSSVIEIRAEGDSLNNCFFSLASDMEHDYYYFLGSADDDNYYESNLHIDPKKFENFLESIDF